MDSKQKAQLQVLLKARKRADKVLAQRRESERTQQDHNRRLKASQELMQQYTQELTALAEESGILGLAEEAAQQRGGSLGREVSCYIFYGLSSSSFQNALGMTHQGELRASHLSLLISWVEAGACIEAEIRVHKNGMVTFHNSRLPVFSFVWRRNPRLLQEMLESALKHPRPHCEKRKKRRW